MELYPEVRVVNGVCGNCGDDVVLFLSPHIGTIENGANECNNCETTDFRPAV